MTTTHSDRLAAPLIFYTNARNLLLRSVPLQAHNFLHTLSDHFANVGQRHANHSNGLLTREEETRRSLHFWKTVVTVYGSYKVCQFRSRFTKNTVELEELWENQHVAAADTLYHMCVDLGGFFLKAGQTLAKPDLSPKAWVKRLSVLHDSAPADPFPVVRRVVESEMGSPLENLFASLDEEPVGSASIAQVHRGILKNGKEVAVKVQHDGVQPLMMTDLTNLKRMGAFLQKFELKLDLQSMVEELEEQVKHEFDFCREGRNMDSIASSLALCSLEGKGRKKGSHGCISPVTVPRSVPGMVTKKVLVMDYINGVQIMKMGEEMARRGINPTGRLAGMAKRNILKDLTSAYGHMILVDGHFQADPHPGNILVCPGGKVALLDYGQTKRLSNKLRLKFAKLVLAVAADDVKEIGRQFKSIGIVTQKNAEQAPATFRRMGTLMFDTRTGAGMSTTNPFASESSLKENAILSFPKELFFVLRTMQLLRGLSVGMGVNYSAVEQWKPLAKRVLEDAKRSKGFQTKYTTIL